MRLGFKALTTMPDGPRYEDDFFAWTQYQAEVLRSMPVSEDDRFDRENVAEEIEALGRCELHAVFELGAIEVADSLPKGCAYSLDDICQDGWYPEPPGEAK